MEKTITQSIKIYRVPNPKYTHKALSPKALNTKALPQNLNSKYTQRVLSPKSHEEKSKFL